MYIFHDVQVPTDKTEFMNKVPHITRTTWKTEPCADEFNAYLDFMWAVFNQGIEFAICNEDMKLFPTVVASVA